MLLKERRVEGESLATLVRRDGFSLLPSLFSFSLS
jgi:hypothetical protein